MSQTRYDAIATREYQDRDGNKKTSFTRIGVAFPMRDKDGFSIQLEAIPAPSEGVFKILLLPPKPRDDTARAPAGGTGRMAADFDDGDSIPFGPAVL